jgi:glycosyltransferase involved in cell wall biosynthesis
MGSKQPMITVIIPVKNRANYLYHTLQTCTIQDYENFQVIVSDDGSTDNLREIVDEASRKDSRIKYVSPNNCQGVGMRDNFEYALSLVNEGYVIALGGDDALLPKSISKMANILITTNQDILSWPAPTYIYPGAGMDTGQLILHTKKGRLKDGYTILKTEEFLNRQAKNFAYASDLESPMFYVKGVVSIDLVNKVKKRSKDQKFYQCSTPDGYSGIVLAGEVESYVYSYEPLSLFGLSSSSQGMNFLSSDEKAVQNSFSFFNNVVSIKMHKELASQPYSPLISLMTADYLLTARDLDGWRGKFPQIDYKVLLSKSADELSHGLYSESRLNRELQILYKIAKFHNLDTYFERLISKKKRYKKKSQIEGNAFSPDNIFIDCTMYNIEDIFEASYFVTSLYQIVPKTTFKTIIKAVINSLMYKIKSKVKGDYFPDKSCWK